MYFAEILFFGVAFMHVIEHSLVLESRMQYTIFTYIMYNDVYDDMVASLLKMSVF